MPAYSIEYGIQTSSSYYKKDVDHLGHSVVNKPGQPNNLDCWLNVSCVSSMYRSKSFSARIWTRATLFLENCRRLENAKTDELHVREIRLVKRLDKGLIQMLYLSILDSDWTILWAVRRIPRRDKRPHFQRENPAANQSAFLGLQWSES